MSGTKETTDKNNSSTVTISSDSSPTSSPSKEKTKNYQTLKANDVSPPAPVSSIITQSKVSLQTNDSSVSTSKADAPETSPPSPPEEKKSPPPESNPPPKQTPKSPPPPSPPSPSESPPKQQSPPQQTPTTPTKQSPAQQEQPKTTPTQESPAQQSTSTPTQQSSPSSNTPDQQSTPSSTPTKKQSPQSPSNPTKKPSESSQSQQNSPSDSTESSSDSNPSPSTSNASQSPPSTASTTAPTSVTASTGTPLPPGFPPQTSVNMPQPSNAVGGSSMNNNSGSSNNALNITDSEHPSYGFVIGATIIALLIIAFFLFLFFRDRRKNRQQNSIAKFMATPANIVAVTSDAIKGHPPQNGQQSDMENSSDNQNSDDHDIYVSKTAFSYEEMMEMTDGFARDNMIGEGGFGCVYKGRMSDGKFVAVKQLKIGSGQGEREFRAEVEIISRVHHRHLVSLVGYCIANKQRLLIYEFVPNSTLERHLHGKDMAVLEWAKRVKIAVGTAKGLAYLHEDCHPKIIHRDIKSANILLDKEFEAQVADFGLARLIDTSHSHVSTRVMGTFGYLAPEYASSGKLTDKSDVYSFGVVILELITGRKPVDPTRPLGDESLVEWARPHLIEALKTGDFGELIDPRLEKRYVESEMFRMMEAAAACVRHSAAKRPRMALVARALDFEGDPDLSNGVKVGQSRDYDSAQYSEEITRFRMEFGCDNSSESEIYSDESISRELLGRQPKSGISPYSSGESTIGEPGTQGSKPSPSGR